MDMPAAPGEGDDYLLQDLDLLESAVREAGALALSYFGREIVSKVKLDGTRVSEADFAVDEMLRSALTSSRPHYGWLSEETADDPARLKRSRVWIVDPIDGTTAFLAGTPLWTIAAALVEGHQPVLGVVYNPVRSEMFVARRGHGAFMNGEPITVRDSARIEGISVVASSGLFKKKKLWREPWPRMEISWINSAAYRLACIANGRVHAAVSPTPKSEWDLAAPTLLVQEAGGVVTENDGRALTFNQPVPRHKGLVAAGPELHRLLIERTRTITDSG
jgi:myo-inositol-1(or 4)-monophosphatase